ncbi:MAG: hypothetical protein LUF89_11185 [Ruminococcus sp.]|nr:hypothetical protein [Ruminococcus sp.]
MLENYFENLNVTQKNMFVALSKYAAMSNHRLDQAEKDAIDAWCEMMSIKTESYQVEIPLDKVLSELNASCDDIIKKVIFSEILSILAVDGEIDDDELAFAENVSKSLEISKTDADEMITICIRIMNDYNALNVVIYR